MTQSLTNKISSFLTRPFREFYNNTLKYWIGFFTKTETETKKYKRELIEHSFKDYPLSKTKLYKYLKFLKSNSKEEVYLMFKGLVDIYEKDNNEYLRMYINKKIWNLEKDLGRKL